MGPRPTPTASRPRRSPPPSPVRQHRSQEQRRSPPPRPRVPSRPRSRVPLPPSRPRRSRHRPSPQHRNLLQPSQLPPSQPPRRRHRPSPQHRSQPPRHSRVPPREMPRRRLPRTRQPRSRAARHHVRTPCHGRWRSPARSRVHAHRAWPTTRSPLAPQTVRDHVPAVVDPARVADPVPVVHHAHRADSVRAHRAMVRAAHVASARDRVPVAHARRVVTPQAQPPRNVRVADVVHHQP